MTLASITRALPTFLPIPKFLIVVREYSRTLLQRHYQRQTLAPSNGLLMNSGSPASRFIKGESGIGSAWMGTNARSQSQTQMLHSESAGPLQAQSHGISRAKPSVQASAGSKIAMVTSNGATTGNSMNGSSSSPSLRQSSASAAPQANIGFEPPQKRAKPQEGATNQEPGLRGATQNLNSPLPSSIFDTPLFNLFTEASSKLFDEATNTRLAKSNWNRVFELEAKAVHASLALLKVQIDNLVIRFKNNHGSGSYSAPSKRSQNGSRRISFSSVSLGSSSSLTSLFHVKMSQRADTEMLTLGIFVSIRRIADFLLERLAPPKSAPLSLFAQGTSLLEALIDLMTILPPGDTQLPAATAGLLNHLCELPFANVSSSQSIYRPSMIPMPSEQQKFVVHANVQSSTAPEVMDFIDRALLLSASFLYRSGEPNIFNAALNDPRPAVVLSSLRHFPILMVKLPETILHGDILSNFFHTALTLLKAQTPFPSTIPPGKSELSSQVDVIDATCGFFQRVACALQPVQFLISDPDISQHSHVESVDRDLKVAIVHNASASRPTFSIVCSGRCTRHFHSPTFLSSSSVRIGTLATLSLEWELVTKLLAECHSPNLIDPAVRLMLLNARKSVFFHCLLGPLKYPKALIANSPTNAGTNNASLGKSPSSGVNAPGALIAQSTSGRPVAGSSNPAFGASTSSLRPTGNGLVNAGAGAASSAMQVDAPTSFALDANATTAVGMLSKDVSSEISNCFHIAIHGVTQDLRMSAGEAIVAMIEPMAKEKGESEVNNAILQQMGVVAAGLNRSTSQASGMGSTMDEDGIGAEETMLNLVGRIGGRAEGWYLLPPLLMLLNYLTDMRVSVKACAYNSIRRLSSDHGMEPKEVLKTYEKKIAIHLLKSLRLKASLIDEVCLTVLDTDPVTYLTSALPVLLPKVVLKRDGELLNLLAQKTKLDPAEMLIHHMASILVATVCKPNTPFDIVQFIVDITKVSAVELFSKFHRGILLGVILLLGDKSRKKFVGFALTFLMTTLSMAKVPAQTTMASSSAAAANATALGNRTSHHHQVIDVDASVVNTSTASFPSSQPVAASSTLPRYTTHAELLADRFLLLSNSLVYDHILRQGASGEVKLRALRAYKGLVKLLGPHIDKFYVIIGSVLRLTMTECTEAIVRKETCKAWFSFLRHLPDRCLGPILGPTTVFLLSYEAYESDIVPILEYLFITKEAILKPFFRDVPLLPDRPGLYKVHLKWKEAQPSSGEARANDRHSSASQNRLSPFSSSDLRVQLAQIMSLAKNDDCSIREMALKQLINFLRGHRIELAKIAKISGRELNIDPIVVELMELLLKGSRDQVTVVRLKFAKAMGELGAIDPSLLSNLLSSQIIVPHLDHTEEEFAVELIEKYLVKTYRTARSVTSQDRACFTIQEILKFFECDASTPSKPYSSRKRDTLLWSKLTTETKSLVHPFLASEYRLDLGSASHAASSSQLVGSVRDMGIHEMQTKNQASSSSRHPMPTYGAGSDANTGNRGMNSGYASFEAGMSAPGASLVSSFQPGMSYAIWLELWLERLIIDSKSGLFRACEAIIANDFETSHFILPHLVLSILHNGSPAAHESILHEMLVVLGARMPELHMEPNVQRSASNANYANPDLVNPMAAQRIFTLVDCLSQWVEGKYKEYREKYGRWTAQTTDDNSKPKVDPRVTAVERLLSKIPQLAVAKTALSINAYSRALMHFEKSARVKSEKGEDEPVGGVVALKPIRDPGEIAVLQQIYGNLDDPDGLEALKHVKGGSNVTDLLDSYRASGRWNDTLIVLDQLLRQRQTDNEMMCNLQVGRLECLAELGLFDQLLALTHSCLSDPSQTTSSKHTSKLRSYGAHAAWKLGDWSSIEALLHEHASTLPAAASGPSHATSNHHHNPLAMFSGHFDLGLGQILLSLRNKKRQSFDAVLQALRSDLLQPLAAASLESYDRTYPLIVKLQMLNELEESWTILYGSHSAQNPESANSNNMAAIQGIQGNHAASWTNSASNLQNLTVGPTASPSAAPRTSSITNTGPRDFINVSFPNPETLDKSIGTIISSAAMEGIQTFDAATSRASSRSPLAVSHSSHTISAPDRLLRERLTILNEWRHRLEMTQYSYKVREAILSLRLAVFGMAEMQNEATEAWLQLAKISRKTGRFTMAQYAMLRVRDGSELASALESAKLLWASNERSKALIEVEAIVEASKQPVSSSNLALNASATNQESRSGPDVSRMRLLEGQRGNSSKSIISRSNSTLSGRNSQNGLSEQEIYTSAKLLRAKWMMANQYSVQSIHEAFVEAIGPKDLSAPSKVQYYNGVFSDHLCMEYKRKLYSLQVSKSSSTSSSGSSSTSKRTSSKLTASLAIRTSTLPPMLTTQAQQYWITMRAAFSAFALSLISSTKFSYQTLPRLVSMWFEITESLQDLFVRYPDSITVNINPASSEPLNVKVPNKENIPSADKTARQVIETFSLAMRMVHMLYKHMPPYVWLISYSLLISGCVQRNKEVEDLIGRIILKVLQSHPQQAIWHIFPLNYSNNEERKQKYHWIRKQTGTQVYKGETTLHQFFDEAAALAQQFSVLCAHKLPKDKSNTTIELNLSDMCLIEQRIPKELIMPSEQQLSCVHLIDASKDPENPFGYQPVYIRRAHAKVQVLKSLARPRKLILYGSDDAEYWFLCKPVDDLRKDARMMEFSGMVNRLLKKDLETRQRDLKIRTYAVLPLSDNSGILSWVPNTNGLRGIIGDTYAMDGLDLTEKIKEIRKLFESTQSEKPDIFEGVFRDKILPKFPLALSKWFLQNFAEPSQWLKARTNFARTCGVMSVVGTILGLGDRHCENILIDSKNGDCLHVDLNCIFHKGRSFAIPEVVPFRLTRNMVDAFGINALEGPFRRACELTMLLMRQNKDALVSVLGTFVHDPLLEWSSHDAVPSSANLTRHQLQQRISHAGAQGTSSSTSAASNQNSAAALPGYSHERHNKLAVEIINGISDRLDGLMRTPDNLDQLIVPLSVQGFVDAIIKESTSNALLCKMYIGWSPFL
jgi:hypothetical protein